MNRILKHIFYTITSGRPMTLTNDAGFLDIVCGKIVNNYTDYFGRE